MQEKKVFIDLSEDDEDSFEVSGIKIEKEMDENLKKTIAKYNLIHEKIVADLKEK